MTTAPQLATVGRSLWVWWVLSYAVSYFVGNMMASAVVPPVVDAFDAGPFITGPSRVVVTGLTLGLLQWLILRQYIVHAHRWMWATIGGLALLDGVFHLGSMLVLAAIDREIPFFWAGAAVFLLLFLVQLAVFGATGLMQWLVLRTQVQHAGRWITATVAAHFLGTVTGVLGGLGIGYLFLWLEVDGGLGIRLIVYKYHLLEVSGGVVVGAVTGAVLVRLLRQPAAGGSTDAA